MLLSLFPHLCFKVAPCSSCSESHILCFKVAPHSSCSESHLLCFKVAPCVSYSESHILCFKVAPCSSCSESHKCLFILVGIFHYRTWLVYSYNGLPQMTQVFVSKQVGCTPTQFQFELSYTYSSSASVAWQSLLTHVDIY